MKKSNWLVDLLARFVVVAVIVLLLYLCINHPSFMFGVFVGILLGLFVQRVIYWVRFLAEA